jgi:chromosome segregation ATPase
LRKADDLKRLEIDHEQTSQRLRDLNSELDHLRNTEVKNRQHKMSLDAQLADLTQQRNDLIRRLNDMSEKYETYVSQMNHERVDTQKSNKSHVKNLVAKLLFQILDENITRTKKNALCEIASTAKQMTNLELRLKKMQRILSNYTEDRKRSYLRLWYRQAFNVIFENYRRNAIIDGGVDLKMRQKFFFLWRQVYLNRKRIYSNKI